MPTRLLRVRAKVRGARRPEGSHRVEMLYLLGSVINIVDVAVGNWRSSFAATTSTSRIRKESSMGLNSLHIFGQ